MTEGPGEPAAIRIEGLTLKARGKLLLEGANASVRKGELCLLVGGSGTGKSLTLGLLGGLHQPGRGVEASGTVEVDGRSAFAGQGGEAPSTGIVFQDFALLDDVDAAENIRFGLDHRKAGAAPEEAGRDAEVASLLEEFRLPAGVYPSQMSGGMKQRLAVARAMAFQPAVLFYDEPTSGLDPAMSRDVAERIRTVHDRHGMTSVIVTHDLQSLVGIADRILLLDPVRRCLREVAKDEVDAALEDLRSFRPQDDRVEEPIRRRFLDRTVRFLESTGDFVSAGAKTLASLLPRYPSLRWGRHFLWHYLRLGALGSAIPFLAIAGFIAGFITTFFVFSLLPMQGYTEPVLVEEFVGALGFVLYRVVIPGVATLLYASRSGAAIAADVGNRVLTRQVDAMRSHGVAPERYLLTGLAWTSLLGIPLLFFAAYFMARVASVAVFLATHDGHGAFAFDDRFRALVDSGPGGFGPLPGGTHFVLGKLLISALGTAGIAYHVGLRPKPSGTAVAGGVTDAIIRATLFVLCVHLVFALFEF